MPKMKIIYLVFPDISPHLLYSAKEIKKKKKGEKWLVCFTFFKSQIPFQSCLPF